MTLWTSLGWVLVAAAIVAVSGILWWLAGAFRADGSADAEPEFGIPPATRYRPMARLMSRDDLEFLRGQPGYTRSIGDRYERIRRQAVRNYIGQLRKDFRSIHAAARKIVAASNASVQHESLVWMLVRQRARFEWAILRLDVQVHLATVGLGAPNFDPLVQMLEAMQVDLLRMSSAPAA